LITKEIIDHIEGEASLYFEMQEKRVDFVTVVFPHFRGMENMLKGKSALDALVITPRVCGICGHAHLMATVRAIEDAYKNSGHPIEVSNKAQNMRELTLTLEIIQNHLKWLYLVLIPQLNNFENITLSLTPLKGAYGASLATKALAILAGQWPHSSYMIPGGVTSDPTYIELMQLRAHLEKLSDFLEKETLGTTVQNFLSFESCKNFNKIASDVSSVEQALFDLRMHKKGFSHDDFIVLGEHRFTQIAKSRATRLYNVDITKVHVEDAFSPQEKSYAKNALYKNAFYETGPLARLISKDVKLIKNMHRRYKDSNYTRAMARIYEMVYLLQHSLDLVKEIDITQDSCTKSVTLSKVTAQGIGVVEAPRGPLIHKIKLKEGIIERYEIITPTQWNISSGTKLKPSPAQKAMIGLNKQDAEFVFRTFDVCSVCTTH